MYFCLKSTLTICFFMFVNVSLVQGDVNASDFPLCPLWDGVTAYYPAYNYPDLFKSDQCARCKFNRRCICCKDTQTITCTKLHGVELNDAKGNFTKLWLDRCDIKYSIPSKAFGDLPLKFFKSSVWQTPFDGIDVKKDAFWGQKRTLKELYIHHKIKDQSPHEFLRDMSSLESLHLSLLTERKSSALTEHHSPIQFSPFTIHDSAFSRDELFLIRFSGTKRLKKLHLNFYKGDFRLGYNFLSSCKKTLEKLVISGDSSNVKTDAALVETAINLKNLILVNNAGAAVWKQIKGKLPKNLQTLKLTKFIKNRSDLESLQKISVEKLFINGNRWWLHEDLDNSTHPIQLPSQVPILNIRIFTCKRFIQLLLDGARHAKLTQLLINGHPVKLSVKSELPNLVALKLIKVRVVSPFNLNQFPHTENVSIQGIGTISTPGKKERSKAKIVISQPLTNLKILSIRDNALETTNNHLVGEDCFAPKLTSFTYVNFCHMFDIDFLANCHNLESLEYQSFSYFYFEKEVNDIMTMLFTQNVLNLDKIPPSVRKLIIPKNGIRYIKYTKVDQILQIEELDLSWNYLDSIPNIFKFMPNLKHLNLQRNEIAGIISLASISPNLLTLDLARNNIQDIIYANHFTNMSQIQYMNYTKVDQIRQLEELDLSDNNLESLPNIFKLMPNLKHLKLQDNKIAGIVSLESISPNLLTLDLAYNYNIQDIIDGNHFTNMSQIQYMNYTKVDQIRQLEKLDLSYNNLESLPNIFKLMPNLKHLNLQYNEIAGIVSLESISPSLLTLDLGSNNIQDIIDGNHLTNVNHVNLGSNQLTKIPKFLRNSKILDTPDILPDIWPSLNLYPNPISCTPELSWFWCLLTSRKHCLIQFRRVRRVSGKASYKPFYLNNYGSCKNVQERCTGHAYIQYCTRDELKARRIVSVPVLKYLEDLFKYTKC